MIIALDYDKTYTADELLWDRFIKDAHDLGHNVICITMRYYNDEERIKNDKFDAILYTERKAKLIWARQNHIHVDIWIDDNPGWLFDDAASVT